MGNETEFHFGKKRSREGLEFVGGRKRSSFRQKVDHIEAESKRPTFRPTRTVHEHHPVEAVAFEPAVTVLPPEAVLPAQPVEPDPLAHIYQEPMLTPAANDSDDEQPEEYMPPAAPHEPIIRLHEEAPPKPRRFRKVLSYFIAAGALLILGLSVLFIMHNTPNIPGSIRSKAGFAVYDLAPNPTFTLDKKSVMLNTQGNVVYFVDNLSAKAHFVISQQKIPTVVANEADYQQFLADFDKYAEFNSVIGKAYFTHPSNIGSDISVVVKTSTTLLFIRGPGTTTDTDWTKLLSYLKVVK